MILLCGIPSETPLRLVTDRIETAGVPFVMLNQREFADCDVAFEIDAAGVRGGLRIKDSVYPLEEFHAVYQRLMDDRNLPELEQEPPSSPLRTRCRAFHDTLIRWLEISPARVVNRSASMASNSSKPYQTQLIRERGFRIPDTLITNDPALVQEFYAQHGRVIYKSISAVRSIVQTLDEGDFDRLEHIRWCPTQFQAFIEGTNLRVHTIGDDVYATAIRTDATDYRYAAQQCGVPAELSEVQLSDELAEQCLGLASSLGLEFAGIDLKVTPNNDVYCFEVNPCPAFSYYEKNAGQPISEGVARFLMGAKT
jgi:glutathione synthase/RimK-type ligase-like ATP-grasp enzyme